MNAVRVPLTQGQFDALCSFCFNVGIGAFKKSTLVKVLNKGNYRGAADEFLKWKKPPEIIGRRRSEREQFLAATRPKVADSVQAAVSAGETPTVTTKELRVAGSRTIKGADQAQQGVVGAVLSIAARRRRCRRSRTSRTRRKRRRRQFRAASRRSRRCGLIGPCSPSSASPLSPLISSGAPGAALNSSRPRASTIRSPASMWGGEAMPELHALVGKTGAASSSSPRRSPLSPPRSPLRSQRARLWARCSDGCCERHRSARRRYRHRRCSARRIRILRRCDAADRRHDLQLPLRLRSPGRSRVSAACIAVLEMGWRN